MILGENMLNGFLGKFTDCTRNISMCTKGWFILISFFPSAMMLKSKQKNGHIFVFKVFLFRQLISRSLFLRTEQYKSATPNLIIILYILVCILSRDLPWAFHWAKASWLFSHIVTMLHEQCWRHQEVCFCFIVFLLWKILSMHLLVTETLFPEF